MKTSIKYFYLHFSFRDFNLENFKNQLIENFKLNTTYSILVKIACDNNLIFKMCGPQIGLVIKNKHDLSQYDKIYSVISDRIEQTELNYNYIEVINSVEIMYTVLTPQTELLLKNINNLNIPKQLVSIKKVKEKFHNKFLPLTLDISYFGIPVLSSDSKLNSDIYSKRQKLIDLIYSQFKIIKTKDEIIILDKDKLFIYEFKKKKYIILSKKINDTHYLRYVFDFETGIFLEKVKDTILSFNNQIFDKEVQYFKDNLTPNNSTTTIKINNDKFSDYIIHSTIIKKQPILWEREINSVTLTIENQTILSMKIYNKLNAIKSEKKADFESNTNFGTFDIESFVDNDGLAKVYALGFITNIDNYPNLYYLTDFNKYDSEELILNCLDDMLISKYNKFIFYAHNFSKYDIIFIYNVLLKANIKKGFEYYILNTTMKDNIIIRLDIKIKKKTIISNRNEQETETVETETNSTILKKKNKTTKTNKNTNTNTKNLKTNIKFIKISFVDSLLLLNNNLDKLSKEFNVKTKKGQFPHSFVNRTNLKYIGKKPDISYYPSITEIDYKNIKNLNWNLKEECLQYLHYDLTSLLEILKEFSKYIFINFNSQMTEALTITRLALNIFKNKFYKSNKIKEKNIPLINKLYLFNYIKTAYYGGITEVYKPYGSNLRYYDVNSLYPFVALNDMAGTECHYLESYEEKGLNLTNLFGFFYCKVKTKNQYLGLLPMHINNSLILPNGEFYGIWASEELKFAKEKGYEITVIKGYNFNKVDSYFKEYILKLFDIKKNSTGSTKIISKSLLNNLLGRFGLNFIKPISQTMNLTKRDYIFSTRKINSQKILNEEKVLVTYQPNVSEEICSEHGLDYFKVLEKESKINIEKSLDVFKDVSIPISAMITAYARIYMTKIKLEILNKGGNIFYSDTDSIVTDLDLNLIEPQLIGKELGQFKLEYLIKEAYFISNKTYCLVLESNEVIIKTKGALNTKLTLEDFIKMYRDKENIQTFKNNTVTNYEKGSVIIEQKQITLKYDSYNKREKIFNDAGIWVDTKALNINRKL